MRELRTCDFCGADAVGTFAVVPPELEPTEDEQRRVVLCPDCQDRLEDLLEPLLARAGADDAGSTTETVPADRSAARDGERSAPDETDVSTDAGSGGAVASVEEPTPNRTGSAGSDAADADGGAGAALEEGITFERSDPVAVAPDEDDETGRGNGDGSETASADASGAESATDADSSGDESAGRPPKAYAKVIRLLQNREFPMQRSAVENLAAGAYDLESHEVDAIIDHAIEEGRFVEERGSLRRPSN